MADQWEQAAKEFKPDPNARAALAPSGNDDWKIWQQNGTPTPNASVPEGEQPATVGGTLRAMPRALGDLAVGAAKGLGRGAYEFLGSPGDAHAPSVPGGFERLQPAPFSKKLMTATEPSNTAQTLGSYIPTAAALAAPVRAGIDAIPNLERAGKNFQTVMGAARNVPLNLAKTSEPALEAHSLSEAGATMPKVMNKFLQRATSPGSDPMTYEQGRRFASNAGRLSVQESMSANPQMQRQVGALAKALNEANGAAAGQAGVGDVYQSAMNEYRRAMKIQGVKAKAADVAKSTAAKFVLGGLGAAGGYGAYRKLAGD